MGRKALDVSVSKRCPKCKETKPRSEFYSSKSTIHGLGVYCKDCAIARHDVWRRENLPHVAKASKKWRDANVRIAKDHCLRARYRIPLGTYETLFAQQNGQCAICHTTEPGGRGDFHVDHCHDTGYIRGLLCHRCNLGIGQFRHSSTLLEAAVSYLLPERGTKR